VATQCAVWRGSDHLICSVEGECPLQCEREWPLSVQCVRGSGYSVCSVEGEWPISVCVGVATQCAV